MGLILDSSVLIAGERQGRSIREILRSRARPTRKGSESEKQGGRFAHDDSIKLLGNFSPYFLHHATLYSSA